MPPIPEVNTPYSPPLKLKPTRPTPARRVAPTAPAGLTPTLRSAMAGESMRQTCEGFLGAARVGGPQAIQQARANYVHKMLHLVEFPDETEHREFQVGVVGVEPAVDALEGRLVRGKPIRVHHRLSPQEMARMDVLLVEDPARRDEALAAAGKGVLTIGDGPEFVEKGGCVGLVRLRNRVRFRLGIDAIRQAGLRISPKLLEVSSACLGDEHSAGTR
ncbi:MAG: YfiR family protein [Vulcanimicrobiota bacterium]